MPSQPALSSSAQFEPGLLCAAADPPVPRNPKAGWTGRVWRDQFETILLSLFTEATPQSLGSLFGPSFLLSARAESGVLQAFFSLATQVRGEWVPTLIQATEVLTSSTSTLVTMATVLASGCLCCCFFSLACPLFSTLCFLLRGFGALEQGRKSKG